MTASLRVLATAFALLLCCQAYAVDCDDQQRAQGNKALNLSGQQKDAALATHLPWGLPESGVDTSLEQLIVNKDYVVKYHKGLRVPIWVAYRFDPSKLDQSLPRINCFRTDPRISPVDAASTKDDYVELLYDQGHLAPAEDMSINLVAMVNSFLMSNMTPQEKKFNEVIWRNLETKARTWAKARKPLYVITGSIFDRNEDGKRDHDTDALLMKSAKTGKARVAVPSHFYKILVHKCSNGKLESLAFVLPHNNKSHTGAEATTFLESKIVAIADIERVTRINLFQKVSAADNLDKANPHSMWPLKAQSNACGN
jgi:DNA/RNA endonuclease G (NUC1)